MTPETNPNQVTIRRWRYALFLLLCLLLAGCKTRMIIEHLPNSSDALIYSSMPTQVEHGIASWYGGRWIGRLTANGETYRPADLTAAHKKLPFNTRVRVVDLKTGNSLIVRINNRGPYVKGRIIDLSVAAAKKLGTYDRGLAKVRIEALREIPLITKSNVQAINSPKPPTPKPGLPPPSTGQRPENLKKN